MSQTIIVTFSPGQTEAVAGTALEQWAYGQRLQFAGLNLPAAYQVDFSNFEFCGDSIPRIGGADGVDVPVEVLTSGLSVYAFVWIQTQDAGRRQYRAMIRVIPGPLPSPEEPNPEEESVIGGLIASLNDAVEAAESAEENAQASEAAAAGSAAEAAGSAVLAESWAVGDTGTREGEDQNNAKFWAEEAGNAATEAEAAAAAAAESETGAGSAASVAAASATAAATAQTAAETAQGKAEDAHAAAAQSATNAAAAENNANTKAGEAAQSAESARDSAVTATQKASEASASATAAAGSATNAGSAANAAAASATAAGNAQTAAEIAQDKAEDAQEAAETAQNAAETAAASVAGSAAQIAQNTEDIVDLKSALTGFSYSVSNGGTGTKTFPVNLSKNVDYVYTNLSSAGQSLSVVYTDDTTEQISGNVASNASVTINKSKDIKAISGWFNASAAFTITSDGLNNRISEAENDISALQSNVESLDSRTDELEDKTKFLFNVTPEYSEVGYLTTGGTIYAATNARHTVFVPVEGYDKIIAEAYVPTGVYAIAFFANDSLSSIMAENSVSGTNKVNTIYEVNIPSGAKYAMMSHLRTGAFIGDPKAVIYTTDSVENKLNESVFDNVFSRCAFMAYRKFGVIGDSLSVGYTGNPITGQDSNRNIAYSWPQFLARMCGNIALNFGYSGLTSKTWLSSAYGYTRLIDSDNLCQGYILALGVNDTANLTLGTVDDIGTDADTFYRYYSDIITLVNETAPNAHVFLFTMPYPITETSNNFNNAIRTISVQNQFDNVYLVDLAANYNDYFKDDRINGEKSAGHFSCIGYANIAGVMARALSDTMNANPDDFISIPFLPYGSNDILD